MPFVSEKATFEGVTFKSPGSAGVGFLESCYGATKVSLSEAGRSQPLTLQPQNMAWSA